MWPGQWEHRACRWPGMGRGAGPGRVDSSHLSHRQSRAACPEVEPTAGSGVCGLGGESERWDVEGLRCFSIPTREFWTSESGPPVPARKSSGRGQHVQRCKRVLQVAQVLTPRPCKWGLT